MARVLLLVALLPVVFLVGCGGAAELGPPAEGAKSGRVIAESPSWDQLQSDLARAGKPLPEFLTRAEGGAVVAAAAAAGDVVETRAYMTLLSTPQPPPWTGGWKEDQTVSSGRVQWYECLLTNVNYPTDVALKWKRGDPDLFVFTPMWWGGYDLELIGYSIHGSGLGENVGSFYPRGWGGPGRYIAAVYGFGSGTSKFDIRFW